MPWDDANPLAHRRDHAAGYRRVDQTTPVQIAATAHWELDLCKSAGLQVWQHLLPAPGINTIVVLAGADTTLI